MAMGFTLVYSGEHYAIDIFLGWAYAAVVFCLGNVAADRWRAHRTRRAAWRELARSGGLVDEPV
jgi:membrane-associated phospholipid phosphatase